LKAIITVIGKDTTGIIAAVSSKCSEYKINIMDITQKVLDDTFAMIMMVDLTGLDVPMPKFVDSMEELGKSKGLIIHTMHEDIFNSMHKI